MSGVGLDVGCLWIGLKISICGGEGGRKSIQVEKGAVQIGLRASSIDVGVRWGSSLPSGKKGAEGVGV